MGTEIHDLIVYSKAKGVTVKPSTWVMRAQQMGSNVWVMITVITVIIRGKAWAEFVVWVRKADGGRAVSLQKV